MSSACGATAIGDALPGKNRAIHASAVARDGAGVLLIGPPGAGKSGMVLRLLEHDFRLIADDQVILAGFEAAPPPALEGLLEVRGLGIIRLPFVRARLLLAVALIPGERLPQARRLHDLDLPLIHVDPSSPSAPHVVALALDCLLGKVSMVAGAFV